MINTIRKAKRKNRMTWELLRNGEVIITGLEFPQAMKLHSDLEHFDNYGGRRNVHHV